MHELSVIQDVVKIVLSYAEKNGVHKVLNVSLKVGELRDVVDEWMQRFFDYTSKGTIAEGAQLKIERVPVVFQCNCGETFSVNIKEKREIACPQCKGGNVTLIAGREFEIIGIEVQ
jgi:hydrogenase nickel incorporation protein HypA/HybF